MSTHVSKVVFVTLQSVLLGQSVMLIIREQRSQIFYKLMLATIYSFLLFYDVHVSVLVWVSQIIVVSLNTLSHL